MAAVDIGRIEVAFHGTSVWAWRHGLHDKAPDKPSTVNASDNASTQLHTLALTGLLTVRPCDR